MAVGTLLASLGSAALSAGVSAGANALLGGGGGGSTNSSGVMDTRAYRAFSPQSRGGALVASPFAGGGRGRGYDVALGADYQSGLNSFRSLSNNASNELGRIRERVQPGFSDLLSARVGALNANRSRTVGNLRDDLARRRVLGSSFANDQITRAESEFALQEADLRARTTLEEIDATVNLINQQAQYQLNAVAQDIAAQANLAGISASLISGVQQNMTALATTNAQLAAQNAAANAQGLGAFFQPAIDAVGQGASDWISGLFQSGSGGGGG